MKQFFLFLTMITTVSTHAVTTCRQRFPEDDVTTDLGEIIVHATCVRNAGNDPDRQRVDQAYFYAHLLTNWWKREQQIHANLDRDLEPLGQQAERFVPQACTLEGIGQNIMKGMRTGCGENEGRDRIGNLVGLFSEMERRESLPPSMKQYFGFLARALSSEDGVDHDLIENARFDDKGRVQLSCEPSKDQLRAAELVTIPRHMMRLMYGRLNQNLPIDPSKIINDAEQAAAQASESSLMTQAAAPIFFDEFAFATPAVQAARQAVAEQYYADQNEVLGRLLERGCGGIGGTNSFLQIAGTALEVDQSNDNVSRAFLGRTTNYRWYSGLKLMQDLQLIQSVGRRRGCEQMRSLLRSFLARNRAMADAMTNARTSRDLESRFTSAINQYESERRNLLDGIPDDPGQISRLFEDVLRAKAQQCGELANDFVTGVCGDHSAQQNRFILGRAYDQFDRRLCTPPERPSPSELASSPMGYQISLEPSEEESEESGDAHVSCAESPQCDGPAYQRVEDRWRCLRGQNTQPANALVSAMAGPSRGGASVGGGVSGGGGSLLGLGRRLSISPPVSSVSREIQRPSGASLSSTASRAIQPSVKQNARTTPNVLAPVVPTSQTPVAAPLAPVIASSGVGATATSTRSLGDRPSALDTDTIPEDEASRSRRRRNHQQRKDSRQDATTATAVATPAGEAPQRPGQVASKVVRAPAATSPAQAAATVVGPLAPSTTPQDVPEEVARVAETFAYNSIGSLNDALVDAQAARTANSAPSTPYLVAGVDLAVEGSAISIPVPPAEVTTVEGYQDYISERIDRELLARQGSLIVQLGDGGTLWKVELVGGKIVVNPVAAPEVAKARRFALGVLQNNLNQARSGSTD